MKKLLPAVILFFLAPAIAELLSGSAPPVEFFSPVGFALLTTLYGSGAILARELTIHWRKGWASLLALGAAYGIVEEGLMVKSFFDPNWVDLGILGSYGRWAGVNWVWSVQVTLYHTFISIVIPILLAELIFFNRRNEAWVGRKGFIILPIILAADVTLGYFFLTAYRPPTAHYILMLVIVAALVLLAWRLPSQPFAPKVISQRHPFWFWLTGFLGTIAFFIVFWGLPHTTLPPCLTILTGLGLVALIIWGMMWMSGNGAAWTGMHQLALAAGPLSFFILLTPIQEFDASRKDNPAGMTLVGLATLMFLVWLWWRVKRSQSRLANSGIRHDTG
ncbi:MAG: hypothetical protein FJ023_02015 [Chloroflexi bacterium]|nr:hypothetical protein [Chloroflexota bacterium]